MQIYDLIDHRSIELTVNCNMANGNGNLRIRLFICVRDKDTLVLGQVWVGLVKWLWFYWAIKHLVMVFIVN